MMLAQLGAMLASRAAWLGLMVLAMGLGLGWYLGGAYEHRAGFKAGEAACEAERNAASAQTRLRHNRIIEEARDDAAETERGLAGPDGIERLCESDPACPDR